MRNYNGMYRQGCGRDSAGNNCKDMGNYHDSNRRRGSRTKLVIEDNTIYEIDLDCYNCKHQNDL